MGTAGVAGSAAPTITNYPRIGVPWHGQYNTWSASNWSGYAETGTFTGVSGTWTVPAVSASSSSTYSSAWIGVDGFNDNNLIQTGHRGGLLQRCRPLRRLVGDFAGGRDGDLDQVVPGHAGRPHERVHLRDVADHERRGRRLLPPPTQTEHVWDIKIADTTKGWSFSTTEGYSGAGSSAEWVMEAPEVGSRIATLAHYTISPPAGPGDFDNAGILTSIVSSGTPTYTAAGLNYQNDSGVMVQNGAQVSTPGDPDTALSAFNAAYGSAVPPTPAG